MLDHPTWMDIAQNYIYFVSTFHSASCRRMLMLTTAALCNMYALYMFILLCLTNLSSNSMPYHYVMCAICFRAFIILRILAKKKLAYARVQRARRETVSVETFVVVKRFVLTITTHFTRTRTHMHTQTFYPIRFGLYHNISVLHLNDCQMVLVHKHRKFRNLSQQSEHVLYALFYKCIQCETAYVLRGFKCVLCYPHSNHHVEICE